MQHSEMHPQNKHTNKKYPIYCRTMIIIRYFLCYHRSHHNYCTICVTVYFRSLSGFALIRRDSCTFGMEIAHEWLVKSERQKHLRWFPHPVCHMSNAQLVSFTRVVYANRWMMFSFQVFKETLNNVQWTAPVAIAKWSMIYEPLSILHEIATRSIENLKYSSKNLNLNLIFKNANNYRNSY